MKSIKLVLILFVMVLYSCNKETLQTSSKKNNKNKEATKIFNKLTNPKLKSEGAYFFNGNNEIIVNWTETHKEPNSNLLKMAFFNTKTNRFNNEITIPTSKGLQLHAESMAKVGKTRNGTLFAFYRRRSKNPASRFGGAMFYSFSNDNGKTWSEEKKLVTDKTSTSQSFFDIALLSDGEIGIIWLDSRKPIDKDHKGKTLYFAKTNSNLKVVENEKPIAGSTCECCRTEIFTDSKGVIHIAYRNIIDNKEPGFTGDDKTEIRDMYYLSSINNGVDFTKPIPLSKDNWHFYGCPHTGPSLAESKGVLGAIWYTGAPENDGIFFIKKEGDTFNNKTLLTKTGYHPQMVADNNGFYTVYEEYYENEGKGYNLIQLEIIKNSKKNKLEISEKFTENDHPVITKINEDLLLIAWVNKNTRIPKIIYRLYHTK